MRSLRGVAMHSYSIRNGRLLDRGVGNARDLAPTARVAVLLMFAGFDLAACPFPDGAIWQPSAASGGPLDGFEGEADELGAVQLAALVDAGAEFGAELVAQQGFRAA